MSNLYGNTLAPEVARTIDRLINGGTGQAGGQVFFANSGAEANECALKLARRWAGAGAGAGVAVEGDADSGASGEDQASGSEVNGSKATTASRSARRSRGSRNGSGGGGQGGGRSNEQGTQGSGRKPRESEDRMEESLTLEQQGEAAQAFVAGLVQEFGLDADIAFVEVDEETVQVAATGDDLGLLVGPRGATLSAVQDLTRTFVQRQSENRTDRILVDVGGYREKRVAALRRFTEGIVHEVKTTGEERALEPMSPADRKVVHDTVNEIEGVETRSDGTEPTRYVVIQPAG